MSSACGIDHLLTQEDRGHITARGMSIESVERQLALFRRGIPFTILAKPCTVQDGITQVSSSDFEALTKTFQRAMTEGRVTKFVPASGAASRMFKTLLACHTRLSQHGFESLASPYREDLDRFITRLTDFAFYEELATSLTHQGHQVHTLQSQKHYQPILEALLHAGGIHYAKRPKGLIPFHRYADHTRTPIEEHLIEAASYAIDHRRRATVHFTILPEHLDSVHAHIEAARLKFNRYSLEWHVTCSIQKPSTDTIAVDLQNHPFRDNHGQLLFRPAGHGALLSNLNDLQADIVFIKNIDNVVPDHLKEETLLYKRILGGLLITLQETLFDCLRQLEKDTTTTRQLDEIMKWAQQHLAWSKPDNWEDLGRQQRAQVLGRFLNRPIRVCGMVKNTGDPGGGPFWVQHPDGSISRQIVESSQVNPHSPEQQQIFAAATHFNPVDMVCGVRDYHGNPFDLEQFVDPNTGFISQKSHEGRELKALELPGLWNGAMAKWHTIFVEVPRETFNPVKTIFDLLLPAHQSQK